MEGITKAIVASLIPAKDVCGTFYFHNAQIAQLLAKIKV